MTGKNRALALLIATDEYADATFQQLRSPRADVEALAGVLEEPSIGDYEVRALHNPPAQEARLAIEDLFADVHRNDLVLLYISGHGVKDDEGMLHFAMTDSRHNRLNSTAIDSQFVHDRMRVARSRRIVICLDCCYAGAFPAGATHRGPANAGVLAALAGKGRAVMTSSSALEYAYEAGAATRAKVSGTANPSVFTAAVVQGLRSGLADRNHDGLIDVDELYEYVHDQISAADSKQTPGLHSDVEGRLVVALSPAGPAADTPTAPASDYRPEYAVPVARLAAEVGQPWERPRWQPVQVNPIIHLVRPTTPDLLNDQLSAHLGRTVPHVLIDSPEPAASEEAGMSAELVKVLDKSVRDFSDHDAGRVQRFRFERYELLTELLRHKASSFLRARRRGPVPDLAEVGTPAARRWLFRQPYLGSLEDRGLLAFAQRLGKAARKDPELVHKLLVHAFLADLAEGYGRQLSWGRWAKRDYRPTLLLRRLTAGTVGEFFVRLVIDVRRETGAVDPLLIIATGPAVLQELRRRRGAVGSERDRWPAERTYRGYVPVLVADQPKLAGDEQSGTEIGVRVWTEHVQRPRLRSYVVRNRHFLRCFQFLETASSVLLVVVLSVLVVNSTSFSDAGEERADPLLSETGAKIISNNSKILQDSKVVRNYEYVTVVHRSNNIGELKKILRAQEESMVSDIKLQVLVEQPESRP